MKNFKINYKEKVIQYSYLIILWVSFSTTFISILFYDHNFEDAGDANSIMEQIDKKNNMKHLQITDTKHLDTLRLLLSQYNPENKQAYLESSILYELNEMKKIQNKNHHVFFDDTYLPINNLYSMAYYDKKATYNTINNTNFLKKNLSECEIGFQQNQNNITLQEALLTNKE